MEGSAIIFVEGENNKSESSKNFDLDDFLDDMGDISRHQMLSAVGVITTLVFGVSLMALTPIFFSATPPHRCAFKMEDRMTKNISNITQEESMIISKIIPKIIDTEIYDSCHRYDYDLSACEARNDLTCLQNATVLSIMKCDEGYVYDRSVYKETVVTEWDLVCDRTILDSLSNSLFFFGFLLGSILSGILGDRCGRRVSMLIFCVGHLGFGLGVAFSQSFVLYLILRIGVAATTVGTVLVAFVYIGEISNNKWRTDLLLFVSLGGAVSNVFIAALAYSFRHWRSLEIVCSVAALTYVPIFFLTCESPRWLLSVGREKEAKVVIETYCNSKGRPLDEDKWGKVIKSERNKREYETVGKRYTIFDLFRYPNLRILSLNVMFSWFATSLVFYGLILNVGNLAGDPFVNTAISSSMDVVAATSIYILIRYIPKRKLLSAAYVLAGTSCLGSMFFQQMNFVKTSVSLACIGRLGVSSSYKIIYLITSDLYPTVARGIGMSLGSMTARIGGMVSPFTVQAQESIPWLMQSLYGSLGLIAGMLGVLYPDTSKSRLMTTLEEAEQFCAENMPRICSIEIGRRRKSDSNAEDLSTKITECYESDVLSSTSSPGRSEEYYDVSENLF